MKPPDEEMLKLEGKTRWEIIQHFAWKYPYQYGAITVWVAFNVLLVVTYARTKLAQPSFEHTPSLEPAFQGARYLRASPVLLEPTAMLAVTADVSLMCRVPRS